MHAQSRLDASQIQDGGYVISEYAMYKLLVIMANRILYGQEDSFLLSQDFYQIVTKDFYRDGGKPCVDSIRKSWDIIKKMKNSGKAAQFRRRTFAASNVNARWAQRLRKRRKLLLTTSALLFSIRRPYWLSLIYNTFISFPENRAKHLRELRSTRQKFDVWTGPKQPT